MAIVAGVDFGTESVRVSIFDSDRGRLALGKAQYPVQRRSDDAEFATQRHEDHCRSLISAFQSALTAARVPATLVQALAIDTTGSTVIPVDEHLNPLDDYYLWCDHRAWREAAEITAMAQEQGLAALDWCGGRYSAEWGFAKVLHWLRSNPQLRSRFQTAIEHCDLMVATLCGIKEPSRLPRSICAMGHKWMWNQSLGGLPSEEFLTSIDPLLAGLRNRLQGQYLTSDKVAGHLCDEWAQRLGLNAGIPIPAGALDAHWDAIGAGCRIGDVVNVIGTSTCVMALCDVPTLIPGVSGLVQGSIHPGKVGIEAGLAAVGDLFGAIARRANQSVADLALLIKDYRAGQTGLLRFPWDNGDRSVLANPNLKGVTMGWRLNHTAADELFAAIEGTAFHTRIILDRLQEYGTPIERVIHGGGIPQRNQALNRVYANVLNKPVLVPERDTTGLGSAIFAFMAAGAFKSIEEAQDALYPGYHVVDPVPQEVSVYGALYSSFRKFYFALAHESFH